MIESRPVNPCTRSPVYERSSIEIRMSGKLSRNTVTIGSARITSPIRSVRTTRTFSNLRSFTASHQWLMNNILHGALSIKAGEWGGDVARPGRRRELKNRNHYDMNTLATSSRIDGWFHRAVRKIPPTVRFSSGRCCALSQSLFSVSSEKL